MNEDMVAVKSEKLAYWYLRLNGFLTVENFVVHPETRGGQRTDVDILGVRFPFRAELLYNPMTDDTIFENINDKPYVIFSEVKAGPCDLNGPWTRQHDQNMHRVLKSLGAFQENKIEVIAKQLYKTGSYYDVSYMVTLFCIGAERNMQLQCKYPEVPQRTFQDVLKFIYNRFNDYKNQKADHSQWDSTGKLLWKTFSKCTSEEEFGEQFKIG